MTLKPCTKQQQFNLSTRYIGYSNIQKAKNAHHNPRTILRSSENKDYAQLSSEEHQYET